MTPQVKQPKNASQKAVPVGSSSKARSPAAEHSEITAAAAADREASSLYVRFSAARHRFSGNTNSRLSGMVFGRGIAYRTNRVHGLLNSDS
jgi:hypothetical protein